MTPSCSWRQRHWDAPSGCRARSSLLLPGLPGGVIPGSVLALLAQIIGCAADVIWARLIGRSFVQARLRGRVANLDRMLSARPFIATLTLRLLPVGNNLVLNLLAGISGVDLIGFVAGSALGYIPQTVIFALVGGGTRVTKDIQIELGVALLLVSTSLGLIMLRHFRRNGREEAIYSQSD